MSKKESNKINKLHVAIGLMVFALLNWAAWYFFYAPPDSFMRVFADQDKFIQFVQAQKEGAAAVYILLQALQVVIAPIPGEFTGSIAGVLFGGMWGAVAATVGLSLGSAAAFLLGRLVGRRIVFWMVPKKQVEKFSFATKKKESLAVLIIFLIPGFPKDSLTYLFSISRIGFWRFFFLSQIGRLPGTVLLTYGADALMKSNWVLLQSVLLIGGTAVVVAFFKRKSLMNWLSS